MQIELSDVETEFLQRTLTHELGELRMEIRATDSRKFKERLEQDQVLLKGLLVRLGASVPQGISLTS